MNESIPDPVACPVHGPHTMIKTATQGPREQSRYHCHECGRHMIMINGIAHEEVVLQVMDAASKVHR